MRVFETNVPVTDFGFQRRSLGVVSCPAFESHSCRYLRGPFAIAGLVVGLILCSIGGEKVTVSGCGKAGAHGRGKPG